jgi:hypothetical protein
MVLGGVLYFSIPASAGAANKQMFVSAFGIISSTYGGALVTVPAYLAGLFGSQMVGAIRGRLLTAWATAGIIGPVVDSLREYALVLGIARKWVDNQTLYILAAILVVGLICRGLVRPVADKHFTIEAESVKTMRLAHDRAVAADVGQGRSGREQTPVMWARSAWAAVGVATGVGRLPHRDARG